MSRTYFTVTCRKCGYVERDSYYGSGSDPIGPSLMRCPKCGMVTLNDSHKEWIHMTYLKKYMAIAPSAWILALFLTVFLLLSIENDDPVIFVAFIPAYIIIHWILVSLGANSKSFCKRVTASIARSRNEEYRKYLAKQRWLLDEKIPPFVVLTRRSRERLDQHLKELSYTKVEFPTFGASMKSTYDR